MKPWHKKISAHIDCWSKHLSNHSWWPKFVYFFTDINNAVSILSRGSLLCREFAERDGLIKVDVANSRIIQDTENSYKRFVRFYFRPRTPTQYRNEGIRPIQDRWESSHCPVPIFFLFDSFSLMSRDDAHFTDISAASHYASCGSEESNFDKIDFSKVFHDGWYNQDVDGRISLHRHAELLIPNEVKLLDYLKVIYCRSHAERETLIYLLPKSILKEWHPKIRIGDSTLFERRWAYVDNVATNHRKIIFNFNTNSNHQSKMQYETMLTRPDGEQSSFSGEIAAKSSYTIKLSQDLPYITVKLHLVDSLAYFNRVTLGDSIF